VSVAPAARLRGDEDLDVIGGEQRRRAGGFEALLAEEADVERLLVEEHPRAGEGLGGLAVGRSHEPLSGRRFLPGALGEVAVYVHPSQGASGRDVGGRGTGGLQSVPRPRAVGRRFGARFQLQAIDPQGARTVGDDGHPVADPGPRLELRSDEGVALPLVAHSDGPDGRVMVDAHVLAGGVGLESPVDDEAHGEARSAGLEVDREDAGLGGIRDGHVRVVESAAVARARVGEPNGP